MARLFHPKLFSGPTTQYGNHLMKWRTGMDDFKQPTFQNSTNKFFQDIKTEDTFLKMRKDEDINIFKTPFSTQFTPKLFSFGSRLSLLEIGSIPTAVEIPELDPKPIIEDLPDPEANTPLSLFPQRTYQPSKLKRRRKHGFMKRNSTNSGRWIIQQRRKKGRKYIAI
eukprot:TRINITY_DN9186_c0_g1_i1.p1 TRINITY_DN9186_c0_g1~~TRINITY_DN9186_c0_g1_i1.p1  ORF type:complete len:167 (-),score=41.03 TRINITY_DN9186_c0_g1_i1:87-587(-)